MKNTVQKLVLLAFMMIFTGLSLFAAPGKAIISEIKGKVEVKAAKSSAWVPAKLGMELKLNDTISTGFDAVATITIDQNILYVKSLSRLSLDKLISDGKKASTTTFLRVGAVEASVNSAEGLKQDFKVQSPYSTASVRGTVFTYDGLRLQVSRGQVAFIPGPPKREPGADPKAPGKTDEDSADGEDGEDSTDQDASTEDTDGEDADTEDTDGEEGGDDLTSEDEGILVGAGTEAIMEVSFTGEFELPQTSDSLESLMEESFLDEDEDIPDEFVPPSTGNIRIIITLPQN